MPVPCSTAIEVALASGPLGLANNSLGSVMAYLLAGQYRTNCAVFKWIRSRFLHKAMTLLSTAPEGELRPKIRLLAGYPHSAQSPIDLRWTLQAPRPLEQPFDLAAVVEADGIGRRHLGQAGHGHDLAADHYQELGPGR